MSATKKKKTPTNKPTPPGATDFAEPAEPIEETPVEETPAEDTPEETPPEPVEEKPAEIATVLVECPLAELSGDGYFANPDQGHVQAQLDRHQALTLNRLLKGLDDTGARLANTKRVGSRADAVRWLLEQLSE